MHAWTPRLRYATELKHVAALNKPVQPAAKRRCMEADAPPQHCGRNMDETAFNAGGAGIPGRVGGAVEGGREGGRVGGGGGH